MLRLIDLGREKRLQDLRKYKKKSLVKEILYNGRVGKFY